ncbi:Uncharacterized protein BP5553_02244 [Venustampulla echinocandica]|uniref:Uncharacterized protein n=1 Tax=Venustampulla echinocandica TaxID=2656787 RepID=A0A370U3C7_9HELO|nr:Uncharacterized protein BP5553_02244 [Venustampulla echinocandica]RDL42265.1 Uncharacterized protein BP5553_02244 [Venustampulla echinocandica]
MAVTLSTPLGSDTIQRSATTTLDNTENSSITIPESVTSQQVIDGGNKKENFLIVSPYDEEPHLLDLSTLDTANQLLAKALTGLKCLRVDYATAPYTEIFNWSEVTQSIQKLATASDFTWKVTSFYIVVFRSRIPPTTVYADLGVLDKAAHAEATKSGGFLKYWFGSPDPEGRNLATCVWRNQHDARVGSIGEAHRKAAAATRFLYTEWKIERLRLIIKDGATDWEITNWED